MRKVLSCLTLLFLSGICIGQSNYQLKIDTMTISIEMDKKYSIPINGKEVRIQLTQRDSLLYSDNFLSFLYPKGNSISQTKADESIDQLTILNSEGSGFIIQKFHDMNPEPLVELMLNEVTKESISYGFTAKKSVKTHKLLSGQEFTKRKEVLRYKDEVNIYEIAAFGSKDIGVIIMTIRMNDSKGTEGEKICNMLWETLRINF